MLLSVWHNCKTLVLNWESGRVRGSLLMHLRQLLMDHEK